MQYEVRLSPDGRDVAIRNLHTIVNQWQTTKRGGQFLTDAQVADWTPLTTAVPEVPTVVITRPPGGNWEVHNADGEHCGSMPDIALASQRVVECVRQAGGVATVVYNDRDSIEHRRARKVNPDTGMRP